MQAFLQLPYFAKILGAQEDFDRAHEYLSLAENYYYKENNQEYLGVVYLNKAIVTLHSSNSPESNSQALSSWMIAEEYLQDADNLYELSRLYFFKGGLLLWQGNSEEGKKEALKIPGNCKSQ
jgi:hypothetical protein